jgi:hypothetical protein
MSSVLVILGQCYDCRTISRFQDGCRCEAKFVVFSRSHWDRFNHFSRDTQNLDIDFCPSRTKQQQQQHTAAAKSCSGILASLLPMKYVEFDHTITEFSRISEYYYAYAAPLCYPYTTGASQFSHGSLFVSDKGIARAYSCPTRYFLKSSGADIDEYSQNPSQNPRQLSITYLTRQTIGPTSCLLLYVLESQEN